MVGRLRASHGEGNAILTGRRPARDDFEELTWALAEQGRAVKASEYLLVVGMLQLMARQIARFFVNHDVWLTPTVAEPPLALGSFDPKLGNPLYGLQRAEAFVPFTPICNVTGQPAMSVPLYWNADGLPIGTHFVGRFGDEATLFRLAAQLEMARPWLARQPKIR
jgi:amidase